MISAIVAMVCWLMESDHNQVRAEMLDPFTRLIIFFDPVSGEYGWQIELIDVHGDLVSIYTNDEVHQSPVLAYADGYIHFLLEK